MSLAPGARLGPYEILAPLGAGGMGEVYKATDTRLGRAVAVKVSREEFSERFEREARAVAALNHPHICQLYDVGPNYLVMEFVDGAPLRPPGEASQLLAVASKIADALVAAHAAGIVHRDLKPDNILVTRDGQVKVLDFGLATGGADALVTQAATAAGTVVGTAAYMSPEQACGEPVDARSDLWSLGVILYELAAGARPFGGPTTAVLFDQILNHPTPALREDAHVPAGLSSIVAKLLEKDRARRYGSAVDVRAALHALVSGTSPVVREAPSVAVLPFANMSADAENEYFCDGIAEEITSALCKVGQLHVAGRTSAFSFKGKTGDLREIGHTLNVGTVLEGSVRKAGNRLRITAQLINVADGYHLWSERYDRQLEDIFDIQDEIALAVVEALKVTLLGAEKEAVLTHATGNPEAYRLCLQARHVWQRWTDEGFRSAIALFNEAIAADSHNALAHTGLADCCLAWGVLGRQPWDLPKIRTAFETALRLNPDAGPPHAVYGAIVYGVMLWNWPLAEAECRKAAELAPREGHVWSCYGILLSAMGRHEEAITMHRRAVELDPVSPFWNAWLIAGLLPTRDWEEALRETDRTLATLPEYWLALIFAGQAHGACGRWDEAVVTFERAVRSSGDVPYAIGLLGHALARAGRQDEARQLLAQLRGRAESHYVPAAALAFAHAGLNERDDTFALLARALDVRDHWAVFSLTNFPVLDDLRPDPRFAALRRRIGLS